MERWQVVIRFLLVNLLSVAGIVREAEADQFSYLPTNDLVPMSGRGDSVMTGNDNAPNILFPIETTRAYANSQVYNPGGGSSGLSLYPYGGSGLQNQKGTPNFSYPWRPNFCEYRGRAPIISDTCRNQSVDEHLGQDIRGPTTDDNVHRLVAVTSGTIRKIVYRPTYDPTFNPAGSQSAYVDLEGDDKNIYSYVHLDSIDPAIREGQRVQQNQLIGKMSNIMGTSTNYKNTTTVHLHFELRKNGVVVSPYLALVHAYERMIGQPGVQKYRPGEVVYAAKNLSVYGSASAVGAYLGTVAAATKGVVLGGPVESLERTWFQVDWDVGPTGWVEDFLMMPRFNINDRAEAFGTGPVRVLNGPGGSEIVTIPLGSVGTILTHPTATYLGGTHLWRQVRWDSGQLGWVEEYYLKNSTVTSCVAGGASSLSRSARVRNRRRKGSLGGVAMAQCGG
ncbi:MAG: M23 family metallopeptidase, partial [Patescibacteria group bacterium]